MATRQGELYRIGRQFQHELLARERAAASEMVRYYGVVWQSLDQQIVDLVKAYYNDPDRSTDWLYRYNRLSSLRSQVERQIADFARFASERIRVEQLSMIDLAQMHAEELVRASLGPAPLGASILFNRLPVGALNSMIGFLQNGTPLLDLLMELGPEAGQMVADGLVSGLALGWNPIRTARSIRKALGGNMVRALRIARTEMIRAYRESTRSSYQANQDMLHGWIWMSARNERTCAMCWAMHGTKHNLDEQLDDHPNGRCTMLPWTKTWEELGFPGIEETTPQIESGESLFSKLSAEEQRKVLGPAKWAAWKEGQFKFGSLVARKFDSRWGSMRFEASLKDLIGAEAAKDYSRLALMGIAQHAGNYSASDLIRLATLGMRNLTAAEITAIREYAASLPFNSWNVRIPAIDRGLHVQGAPIGSRYRSDLYHLAKRIQEGQWADGTTFDVYLSDLKKTMLGQDAQIVMYSSGTERYLCFFANNSIAPRHLGAAAKPYVYVICSTKEDVILSGYQVSNLQMVRIPEDARWFK